MKDLPWQDSARLKAALRVCTGIAEASGSNLWFVGRTLSSRRRALFVSSYASMRVIDDFVDDEFLMQSDEERRRKRPDAHAHIQAWLDAIDGNLSRGEISVHAFDVLSDDIQVALSGSFSRSDLALQPWEALAQAMRRDIDEKPFVTWDDFHSYCEGATVAPAAIFLYLLAARFETDGSCTNGLPDAPQECARDIAIFCYLVHIMRDLTKDAETNALLVTLPNDVLEPCGLTRDGLSGGALDTALRDGRVHQLIAAISEHTDPFRKRAEAWRDHIMPVLGVREGLAFKTLMGVYCALHDRIMADPEFVLARDRSKVEAVRAEALSPVVNSEAADDDL